MLLFVVRARLLSSSSRRRVAVFLAGMPGSGKSRVCRMAYKDAQIIDLDEEIRKHPLYDGTEPPSKIYEVPGVYDWANERVEKKFQESIRDSSIATIVLDGTGTKVERRSSRIEAARSLGVWTILLYVKVSLETALRRNAKRDRVVPPHRLKEYQRRIEEAVRVESRLVDRYEIFDNDVDDPYVVDGVSVKSASELTER